MSAQSIRLLLPGLLPVTLIAAASLGAATVPRVAGLGLSALSLAVLAGALAGNLVPGLGQGQRLAGLRFAQRVLLRIGVTLFGFNLDLGQVVEVGGRAVAIDVFMVGSTVLVGLWLGRRVLGLDRDTALLVSAGSAICGAAAVVATVPVLPDDGRQVERTAVAVATVLLFGTLAMLGYPLLFGHLAMPAGQFGTYVGATVHEVAQVVAIGSQLGGEAARNALIVKMIRVMLLVPFLMLVGECLRRQGRAGAGGVSVPWFALGFVACAALHSSRWLPQEAVALLRGGAQLGLALAMAALGIDTTWQRLRQCGLRAFLLGLALFIWLVLAGGLVNLL